MNDIKKMAEIFQILSQYDSDGIAAEHDIIYLGVDWGKLSEDDRTRLEELGCHEDSEFRTTAKFV